MRRAVVFATTVAMIAIAGPGCGADVPAPDDSAGAAGDGGTTSNADTTGAGTDTDSALPAVCEFEVTLPGHEGQFFGSPTRHCNSVFIAGIENAIGVVVGTDVNIDGEIYQGSHDCTLGRDVRYFLDWGDMSNEWTDAYPCDRWLGVSHIYPAAGINTVAVFAEDDAGGRTRCSTREIDVVETGQDLTVVMRNAVVRGDRLTFTAEITNYGNLPASGVELRTIGFDCETQAETTLASTRIDLEPGQTVSRDDEIEVPQDDSLSAVFIRVDPDDEVAELCPDQDRFSNADVYTLTFCGEPIPD